MGILGGSGQKPNREFGLRVNQSTYGLPVPTVMGTAQVQQNLLWADGFSSKTAPSGAKGIFGGKGDGFLYSANVVVALCNGPINGIGDAWSGQSFLGLLSAAEQYTIATPFTYTPVNASMLNLDMGVSVLNTFSSTNNDLTAPTPTVLNGSFGAPLLRVPFGTTLTAGLFSVNPTGNIYNFSSADSGRQATVNYSFLLTTIDNTETDIVPSSKQIKVGGTTQFSQDLGVRYASGANESEALTKVNGTPTVMGTYSVSGSAPATYNFSSADVGQEVTITFSLNDPQIVGQGENTQLNITLNTGEVGQTPYSFLTTSFPQAAFGFSGIATLLYQPMDLGQGDSIQENTFEVITPDVMGGGIEDCNPIQCIGQVLTNATWGFGMGAIVFPTSVIDNGTGGTWGVPPAPGVGAMNSTAWNWFTAQSFFISPVIDSQDTAASEMSKWLEAGMCAAFMSEGLLKLVPYGDTSAAGNGVTWTAPTSFAAAFDDTIFLVEDENADPVKITRTSPSDAWNIVQVQWDNRENQYSPEIVYDFDQGSIDRWGERREDQQDYDFIHTVQAATFSANMRLKRGLYIRNGYTFSVPYTYSFLEPMDIVTITTSSAWAQGLNNANLGINNLPVRITKIVDDPTKGLQITAEDYPFGAHQPVIYNKQISNGDILASAFADPGNSEVVMFEATNRLTGFVGDEIWIGALGLGANWGSCNIFVSSNGGTTYEQVGTIETPARLGELGATFPTGSDPDTTDSLVVNLAENCAAWSAGSESDANIGNTLVFVDGEIIAYSALTVTGQSQITMNTFIRRGQMGSTISSHAVGGLVMRLDDAVFKFQYDPNFRGQTLLFKFQSVNDFGNNAQPLSSLTPVSFTIPGVNPGTIDASTGLIIDLGAQVFLGAWSSTVTYTIGAFVESGGIIYVSLVNSNLNHTPASSPADWQTTGTASVFLGNWSSSTAYVIGNMVIDVAGGGGFYIALQSNTNAEPSTNTSDWQLITAGKSVSFLGTYSSATAYTPGQSVDSAGSQWVCIAASTGNTPAVPSSFWTLLGSNSLNMGTWSSSVAYTANMIVVFSGNLYQAVAASTNSQPSPTSTTPWILTGPASMDNLEDGSIFIKGTGLVSSTNIIVNNSNFQASASASPVPNWPALSATLSYETSTPFPGKTQSLKVQATAAGGGTQSAQTWACQPGDQFVISAALKSDGTETADMGLAFLNAAGTFVGSIVVSSVSTSWTVLSATGAAPANATSFKVLLENVTAGAGTVWFDLINVQKMLTSSATLVGQGSIAGVSTANPFTFANTATTLTWSWTAFDVLFPNGAVYTVAASTGSATSFANPTSGTVQSAATPLEYTGLTANTTYVFSPFLTLNANLTATMNMLWTSTAMPTVAQQIQVVNGDGQVPVVSTLSITALTTTSGSGSGGSGGTPGDPGIPATPSCFSPNTLVKTQNGNKRIVDIVAGVDMVLTARGTWKHILYVTTRKWNGIMLDMGTDELTTANHLFLTGVLWQYASEVHPEYLVVFYNGTIHNLEVDCEDGDDGTAADTEHSYTLANGNIVHNVFTNG